MKYNIKHILILIAIFMGTQWVEGQDTIFYSGTTLSNVDYHHGQLRMAKGVHNIQIWFLLYNYSDKELANFEGFEESDTGYSIFVLFFHFHHKKDEYFQTGNV